MKQRFLVDDVLYKMDVLMPFFGNEFINFFVNSISCQQDNIERRRISAIRTDKPKSLQQMANT